jgi:hypothetical protein
MLSIPLKVNMLSIPLKVNMLSIPLKVNMLSIPLKVNMLSIPAVDHQFEPQSGQTKVYKLVFTAFLLSMQNYRIRAQTGGLFES